MERRGVVVQHSCGDQQLDPSRVGKTCKICCCNHLGCGIFREERWCQRWYVIGVESQDHVGRSLDVSAGQAVVRAALASRSYEDGYFVVVNSKGLNAQWKLIVLLAEGEPPLTVKEVRSWNDDSYRVNVTRGTCCLLRARVALSRLLHLYCHHAVDCFDDLSSRSLLYELVRFCLGTAAGEREIIRELTAGDCTSCR